MTLTNLDDIFALFAEGFIIGALFSGLAFLLGWFINYCLSLVKMV